MQTQSEDTSFPWSSRSTLSASSSSSRSRSADAPQIHDRRHRDLPPNSLWSPETILSGFGTPWHCAVQRGRRTVYRLLRRCKKFRDLPNAKISRMTACAVKPNIVFAFFRIICFLRESGAFGRRFPGGLTFGSHPSAAPLNLIVLLLISSRFCNGAQPRQHKSLFLHSACRDHLVIGPPDLTYTYSPP